MPDYKLTSIIAGGLITFTNCFGSENADVNGSQKKLPEVLEETQDHTLTRETKANGTIVTRVTGPSKRTERITPLIYVDKKMIAELGMMIRDKSSTFYNKALPPVRMSVGTRVFQEESDNPGFGTSISFPLYTPGAEAEDDKKKQVYLKTLLGYLRDLELNQKMFESQVEKLGIIKSLMMQEQTPDRLDSYYRTEGEVLSIVSELNMVIRFFEYQLDIDLTSLKERVHENG